jgi:hypothetical protein
LIDLFVAVKGHTSILVIDSHADQPENMPDTDFSRFTDASELNTATTDRLVKMTAKINDLTDCQVETAADEEGEEAVIELNGRSPVSDFAPAICTRSQLEWMISLIQSARRKAKKEAYDEASRAIDRLE